MAGKEEVFIDKAEPRKKRVRLSSPIRCQLSSSSDDEVTFNPKAFFNSDPIVTQASFNHMTSKLASKGQDSPNTASNTASPYNSPNGVSVNSGNCNISGVSNLTDTTRMSIPTIDIDTSALPPNDDSDIKESPSYSQQPFKNLDCLSPVGLCTENILNDTFSSPDNSVRPFDESVEALSPMDIYELDLDCHQNSSPVQSNGTYIDPSAFKRNINNAQVCKENTTQFDNRSIDTVQDLHRSPFEGALIDTSNCRSEVDSVMQTPASIGRPSSRIETGEAMVQSVFRTPANPLFSKVHHFHFHHFHFQFIK